MGVIVGGVGVANKIRPADLFSVRVNVIPVPQFGAIEGDQLDGTAFAYVLNSISEADRTAFPRTGRRIRIVGLVDALQGIAVCIRHGYWRYGLPSRSPL